MGPRDPGADRVQGRAGQHVAPGRRSPVAEDAVVEEGVGAAVVRAEYRRPVAGAGPRPARLAEPHVRGEDRKADVRLDPSFLVEHGRAEAIEPEPAPALPTDPLGDPARFPFDHLAEARPAVGDRVLAHLDADPAPAHLVRDRGGGTRAEEGIEDEVAGVGGNMDYPFNQPLRFRRQKDIRPKERQNFLLGFLSMAYVVIRPKSLRGNALFYLGQKPLYLRNRISFPAPPDAVVGVEFPEDVLRYSPVVSSRRSAYDPAAWSGNGIPPEAVGIPR